MREALVAAGFRLVGWDERADVRVINTCTVTAKSDRTCRHEIRSAKRLDPGCFVVVTGCYAQVEPDSVAAIPGVDLVLGNIDKLRLAEHIDMRSREEPTARSEETLPAVTVSPYSEHPAFEREFFGHFYGYTRAFLKIQTGCDARCAYCVIPLARGPARSMPQRDVLDQVRVLASHGHREVVLTGINLGSWGRDTGEGSLAELLTLLLEDTPPDGPPVGRFRLSSIEPLEVDAALLDVIDRHGDRVARHFHLPLQSGSDAVLARMGRPYTAAQYLQVAQTVARRFPDAAIGADVIVGFPGETEAECAETLALVERSPLTYLHVFAYSDRPGTQASVMTPKVSPEAIHERSVQLRALGARKRESFRGRLVGTTQRALILAERAADARLVGLTGNYMEVLVGDDETLENRFVRVRLEEPLLDGRWGVTLVDVEPL
jgi:threonylcarbamoyladenosine tRNA methylthiotransferase MtaB